MIIAASAAGIGDADGVLPVGRRGEHQAAILAHHSHRVVVVLVVDIKQGQSISRRFLAWLQWSDNVGRFAERVRGGGRPEVGPACSLAGIDVESRVRSAGVHPQSGDFAGGVQVVVQLQFLPGKQAKVAALIAIFATEGEVRVSHRLQPHPEDRLPVSVDDRDDRVERAVVDGVRIDGPDFTGRCVPDVLVDLTCPRNRATDDCATGDRELSRVRMGVANRSLVHGEGLLQLHVDWGLAPCSLDDRGGRLLRDRTRDDPAVHERDPAGRPVAANRDIASDFPERIENGRLVPVLGVDDLHVPGFADDHQCVTLRRDRKPGEGRFVDKASSHDGIDAGSRLRF